VHVAAPAVGTSRRGDRQVRAATGCRAAPRRGAAPPTENSLHWKLAAGGAGGRYADVGGPAERYANSNLTESSASSRRVGGSECAVTPSLSVVCHAHVFQTHSRRGRAATEHSSGERGRGRIYPKTASHCHNKSFRFQRASGRYVDR